MGGRWTGGDGHTGPQERHTEPQDKTLPRAAAAVLCQQRLFTPLTTVNRHYLARLRIDLPTSGGGPRVPATLAVLGLHLKAIPTQARSCHKREAQAKIAQRLLVAALGETPYVVVLGDLNDFDADPCCLDAPGSRPTSRVLRMLKDPRATGADELHSVASRLPRGERYTDWWDHAPKDGVDEGGSEHSSLDHLLVSGPLFDQLSAVTIDHSTPPMDYSDHWPLIATFHLQPLAQATAPPPSVLQQTAPALPSSPSSPPPPPSAPPTTVDAGSVRLPLGAAAAVIALALVGALVLARSALRCADRVFRPAAHRRTRYGKHGDSGRSGVVLEFAVNSKNAGGPTGAPLDTGAVVDAGGGRAIVT
mmetsp:Transcript_15783/g.49861  ORF Transcript_15783/g.49861 Transcript_15783/m.49861 type:complete len:362 (-) Transcript_15783:133-1218(-)